jgi:hypothetical protein
MSCRSVFSSIRRSRAIRAAGAALALCGAAVITSAPVSAAPPRVITEVTHFEKVQVFPAEPECSFPGSTAYVTGSEHVHLTELADSYTIVYGETFAVTEVFDNDWPSEHRKGTDAFQIQVRKGGSVTVFHESYHERGGFFGNIQLFVTFTVVNGQVVVDHLIERNTPYCIPPADARAS